MTCIFPLDLLKWPHKLSTITLELNDPMKNKIHKPHDKLFRQSLKDLRVAKDFVQAYLPKELLKDLESIQIYNTDLVSPQFKEFEADVIFELKLKEHSTLVMLHAEHQSTPDEDLPLRMWQYILLVLLEYRKNNPDKPLPVIYPLIVYTGKQVYDKSTSLFNMFGNNKELAIKYLMEPIRLVDIYRMDDDEIRKKQWWGLAEFAMKHSHTKQFKAFIKEAFPWVNEIEVQHGTDYAMLILGYLANNFTKGDAEIFVEESKKYLSPKLVGETMTIAEQFKDMGRQEGMQQGMLAGMQEGLEKGLEKGIEQVATIMLAKGMSVESIAELTDLSNETIQALKAKSQQ